MFPIYYIIYLKLLCEEGTVIPTECPNSQDSEEGSSSISDCDESQMASCTNVRLTHRDEQCNGQPKNILASFIDVKRDSEMWTKELSDW